MTKTLSTRELHNHTPIVIAANRDRLLAIDIARIAAASMVMVYHLAYRSWAADASLHLAGKSTYSYPELAPLSSWGWVGVQIFFVISGVVIARSSCGTTAWNFARSRFLRLFPGALICASITLTVAVCVGVHPIGELLVRYLRSITFFPVPPWIEGVYWTLPVEIAFYSVVAGLLVLQRGNRLELAALVIGGLSAINLVFGPYKLIWWRVTELLLLSHGVYFAIGVVIWYGYSHGWTWRRCLAAAALLPLGAYPLDFSAALIWTVVIVGMLTALHIPAVHLNGRAASAITTLSLSTYPLYLVHQLVGTTVMRGLWGIDAERFAALALTCILMIVLGIIITKWPERWLRDRIAGKIPRQAQL